MIHKKLLLLFLTTCFSYFAHGEIHEKTMDSLLSLQLRGDGNYDVICQDLSREVATPRHLRMGKICPIRPLINKLPFQFVSIQKKESGKYTVVCKNLDVEEASKNQITNGSVCLEPLPKQCSTYFEFNEANRNISNKNEGSNCDKNSFYPGWYRFKGKAGSMLATHPPKQNTCGTHAPGWMDSEDLPLVPGNTTETKAFFNWSNNEKFYSSNIQVTHCGDFYVYNLPQVHGCNLRYCGQD